MTVQELIDHLQTIPQNRRKDPLIIRRGVKNFEVGETFEQSTEYYSNKGELLYGNVTLLE